MMIELVGLPGCGKTTLIDKVIAEFSESLDSEVVSRGTILKNSARSSIRRTILWACIHPSMWYISYLVYRLKKAYPDSSDRRKYRDSLLLMCWAIQVNKNKILLLDEGLIQYISSIPHELKVDDGDQKLIKKLCSAVGVYKDGHVVMCDVPTVVVIQRMRDRNRPNDRFHQIKEDDKLEQLLLQKQENLEAITSAAVKESIRIDAMYDLNKNVQSILELLRIEKGRE